MPRWGAVLVSARFSTYLQSPESEAHVARARPSEGPPERHVGASSLVNPITLQPGLCNALVPGRVRMQGEKRRLQGCGEVQGNRKVGKGTKDHSGPFSIPCWEMHREQALCLAKSNPVSWGRAGIMAGRPAWAFQEQMDEAPVGWAWRSSLLTTSL